MHSYKRLPTKQSFGSCAFVVPISGTITQFHVSADAILVGAGTLVAPYTLTWNIRRSICPTVPGTMVISGGINPYNIEATSPLTITFPGSCTAGQYQGRQSITTLGIAVTASDRLVVSVSGSAALAALISGMSLKATIVYQHA